MKTFITLLLLNISFIAFSQDKLYITTYKAEGPSDNLKTAQSTTVYSKPYLEIKLSSQTQKDGTKLYLTNFDVVKPTSTKNFKSERFAITDSKGEVARFKSTTDFLNFMDSKGYKMVTQELNKYGGNYTFQKK